MMTEHENVPENPEMVVESPANPAPQVQERVDQGLAE